MRSPYSTGAREQIGALLARERRYLSAAEIHALLRQANSRVALSTVYRTLDLLEERGEASARLDAHGEATYVACDPKHHHHAICRRCGTVQEVDCDAIEQIAGALRAFNGFRMEDHAMEFFGVCAACA